MVAVTTRLEPEDIPSYLIRRGRTGITSREAHARLWPRYGVVDVADLVAPRVVEIGFGMGEATALMAAADPRPLLAIEVHPAGIASLLRRLEAADLHHVQVWEGNAVPVLAGLPPASLDEVRVFFPDPWPKARHAKRRLLRPSFAELLATRLAPHGHLHLATDHPAYVEHAADALQGWALTVIERPDSRPVTGYERRAVLAGRPIVDVLARVSPVATRT